MQRDCRRLSNQVMGGSLIARINARVFPHFFDFVGTFETLAKDYRIF